MSSLDLGGTVFVVEDDAAVRDSLSTLLEALGVQTRVFSCGNEVLRDPTELVDGCVLLDICLPDVNGFEVMKSLRQAGVTVPIIFMTGQENWVDRASAHSIGAFAVLKKPIGEAVLLSTLSQALANL